MSAGVVPVSVPTSFRVATTAASPRLVADAVVQATSPAISSVHAGVQIATSVASTAPKAWLAVPAGSLQRPVAKTAMPVRPAAASSASVAVPKRALAKAALRERRFGLARVLRTHGLSLLRQWPGPATAPTAWMGSPRVCFRRTTFRTYFSGAGKRERALIDARPWRPKRGIRGYGGRWVDALRVVASSWPLFMLPAAFGVASLSAWSCAGFRTVLRHFVLQRYWFRTVFGRTLAMRGGTQAGTGV
eukprot:TRINITY_DN33693_c0_g1_i1.p1 TRINITY_DN33693_c0_g1~~TRINITY_DN33693_c0_g1_i1.p1  ORF type:complete len:246 (-),score=24.54 TRINITY_DN33693_c0_g1_i1:181-918(-)